MVTRSYTKTTKGRPPVQLSLDIQETLHVTYNGSPACVRSLARQYGVADSTIRAWAHKLGLTQRSRPRPPSAATERHSWKIAITHGDEKARHDAPDMVDITRLYLSEMGGYPRLSAREERLLGERIALGDQEAKHVLILANLRLVVRIAKNYATKACPSIPLLDLIQEGTLGLMHAVDIYDVSRGWRFSTHATWWIRQAVGRAQMEQSRAIRLPIGAQEQIQDVHKFQQQAHGDLPLEIIAERLSISQKRAQELLIASQQVHSLDTLAFGEQGDLDLGHILESPITTPQDHVEALDLRYQLLCLVQTLRLRDRQVIILRYGLDGQGERTLEEVGQRLHVTRERIRQIETRVLLELRQQARERHLQDYLSA